MTEQIRLIAERIKELRELSGTSIQALTAELGIPADLLQQYESGTVDIPVGFLHKIAQRFHVDISVC